MRNDHDNERPLAIVTGGSQGLGPAIALRLAQAGYDLVMTRVSKTPFDDVVSKVEAAGARAFPLHLDLRSQASIEDGFREATRHSDRIEVLVNNAGVTLRQPALDVSRDEWQNVMDTNLSGTFFLTQQMGRYLVAHKRRGSILNIASTHGIVSLAHRSTYGISKGAMIHMTRVLAYEWAEHGIRVNAIAPGMVETPSRAAYFSTRADQRAAMAQRVPLGRFCTEEEVAGAVAYLVSKDADYVTGQTLVLDGGLTTY
ncbi:MAG: SDR family NAD(P)-dependent oxidoreductase [Burkholderiales bacterium]